MKQTYSINDLYADYLNTICMCGSFLLNESDEVIAQVIFEDFDIGVISFLHEKSLHALLDAGMISERDVNDALTLRDMVRNCEVLGEWNVFAVRNSLIWANVFSLADSIRVGKCL